MSRVVVAWKPRSANAVAAARRMRREPAGKWYRRNRRSSAAAVLAASGAVPACGDASFITRGFLFSFRTVSDARSWALADKRCLAYRPKQALSKRGGEPDGGFRERWI